MRKRNINLLIALLTCVGGLAGAQPARAEKPGIPAGATVQTVILPAISVKGVRTGEILLITERTVEIVKADQFAQKSMSKSGVPLDNCLVR